MTSSDDFKVPTVKFDPAQVTEAVKADLRETIGSLTEIAPVNVDVIYDAALRAISAGGALSILYEALVVLDGMSRRRAGEVALSLNKKARALMDADRQQKLGFKYATWRYSGAPCGTQEQDASHKAANGQRYLLSKGMFLDDRWTRPGQEDGCKCVSIVRMNDKGL